MTKTESIVFKFLSDKGMSKRRVARVMRYEFTKVNRGDSLTAKERREIIKMCNENRTLGYMEFKLRRHRNTILRFCDDNNLTIYTRKTPNQESIRKMLLYAVSTNKSTVDISKSIPEFTPAMVEYYKRKHNVVTVRRGMYKTTNPEEMSDLARLAKKGLSYKEISDIMSKKYDRTMNVGLIRDRIRFNNIPYRCKDSNKWTDQEITILYKLERDIGLIASNFNSFKQLLPKRTYSACRKQIQYQRTKGEK